MDIKEAITWLESVELFFINKIHFEDHHIPEKLYHTKVAIKKIKKILEEWEKLKEELGTCSIYELGSPQLKLYKIMDKMEEGKWKGMVKYWEDFDEKYR